MDESFLKNYPKKNYLEKFLTDNPKKSLSSLTNKLIRSQLSEDDDSKRLQSEIHPEILFRYNSINLLISRRGIGKTFTVMKEVIKLSQLPNCAGYSAFIYVSDKTNDETVNEMIKLIKLKVHLVSYSNLLKVLYDLIDSKNAYADALEKGITEQIIEESKKDILSALDLETFTQSIPHTVILLDDTINILRDTKNKPIVNLLFQNRQPRLTIFICIQDMYGISPQIRRNCDTIFLFAGLTDKHLFAVMMSQLGLSDISWEFYKQIPYRGILVIDYTKDGEKIKLVSNEIS
jgi:hypothetical protein